MFRSRIGLPVQHPRPPPGWTIDDDSAVPPLCPARPRVPASITYPREKHRPVVLTPDTSSTSSDSSDSSQLSARSTHTRNLPTGPQAVVGFRTNIETPSSSFPPTELEATRNAAMPSSSGAAQVFSTADLQNQLQWWQREVQITQQMCEMTQQMLAMRQELEEKQGFRGV